MLRPPDYASSSVQIRNARSPPPVAPPVAPEGLMPTDPAGLVSQLEGARGTKLDPVILVRVRRSLHRGDRQSYQAHERGNDHALLARWRRDYRPRRKG